MKRTVSQSWDEEHVEAVRKAREVKPGDHWRFGTYQVIRDKELPKTKLKDNSLTEFLIPEEHVSLKHFFDNLRNYAICAAFIGLGVWLWKMPDGIFPKFVPHYLVSMSACVIWLTAGILLVLNCIQLWILLEETSGSIRAIQISEIVVYRPGSLISGIAAFCHALFDWLSDVSLRVLIFLFQLSVMLIMIGFVSFAVVSTPGLK